MQTAASMRKVKEMTNYTYMVDAFSTMDETGIKSDDRTKGLTCVAVKIPVSFPY